MSAETMHRAVALIRKEWGSPTNARAFPRSAAYNLAMADLLEVAAGDAGSSSTAYHAALTVARAYLGESA